MQPTRIGPYQVESRLGAGGMGEVYSAYDERLERRVAIKTIHRSALENAEAHKRLRREAKAVAGLNHPSIVGIHDILEGEDGDSIVMELVEGRTLSQSLRQGPLPVGRTLRLGREIAEGLAAAHARGILHRDLKSDNVMITFEGRVKILDFGLAKRLAPHHPESSLETGDRILGTCHAMSPEQAQGFAVDHRSDLFSLGTLLYEMAAGRTPFRGATAVETLSRVLAYRPPPVREINPEVPEELSRLIDALLEKDADHRPVSAAEVASALARLHEARPEEAAGSETSTVSEAPALRSPTLPPVTPRPARRRAVPVAVAAVLLLALGAVVLFVLWSPKTLSVAVAHPRVGVTEMTADVGLVASAVRLAALRGLASLEGVAPRALDEVDAVVGAGSAGLTSAELTLALAVDEVVASQLDCTDRSCQVALTRVGAGDGVRWTVSFEVPADDLLLVSTSVVSHLRGGYERRGVRDGFPDLEVASGDYREFLEVRRSFELRDDEVPLEELLERLEAVERSSPRFPAAYVLEAQIAHHRYSESRRPGELVRAFEAARRARELTPGDPQVLYLTSTLELAGGRLDEAAKVLDDLERLQPGDPRVLAQRAWLEERRGNAPEALELMHTAVRRQPSWNHLFRLALLEKRLGEAAAARRHLRASLERSPDNFRSQSLLAELELMSGDPELAVQLYEELVRRSSGRRELAQLGLAYLLVERYDDAVETLRRVVELQPDDPTAALNLADAEHFLGRTEEAAERYRSVLELIERQDAPSRSRFLTVRAQALAHLGRFPEAAAAIQEALQASPASPWVAYEAAVVYTLIGELSSALANVEKALAGVEPRWFELPWFDLLSSRAEFVDLLSRPAAED